MNRKKVLAFSLAGVLTASAVSLSATTAAFAASGAEITVDVADRSLGEISHGVSGSSTV